MRAPSEYLLLLDDHQIDYGSLDDQTLFVLATSGGDLFVATSALGELSIRKSPRTRDAALAALTEGWADRHLRAQAITTLYDADAECAVGVMAAMLESTGDPAILGAMVECVLADQERFCSGDRRTFTSTLAARVAASKPDATTDLDERTAFLAAFGTTTS